ncbi:MAG: hypothetical protein M1835_004222 [Candelina submexicana]|nr:MAG: hypothetical protein M1835_004222 [Candelina submexicana]
MLWHMKRRYTLLLLLPVTLVFLSLLSLQTGIHSKVINGLKNQKLEKSKEPLPLPRHPIYKPAPTQRVIPIVDNFPRAAMAISPSDLPPVPSWNRPPTPHVTEKTPLFISFTRNWLLLQQVVVSYIAAGWPPEDIYVVENTGTFNANKEKKLTLQNPSYIDYHRLTTIFGVNVLTPPTLLSFAQLQNYYLSTSVEKGWDYFFWGHMDVVALATEDISPPYRSLYIRAVEHLRENLAPGYARDHQGREGRWAIRFFAYDWLALVNVHTFLEVGGWDTMIPYYGTDCDMHERLGMANLKSENGNVGLIYDTGASLPDLEILYRRKPRVLQAELSVESDMMHEKRELPDLIDLNDTVEDEFNSPAWEELHQAMEKLQYAKQHTETGFGRNDWQLRQAGGEGEPFYRHPEGFNIAIEMIIETGRRIFDEKWGHRGCDLRGVGLSAGDAWRVEHDWYVCSVAQAYIYLL